jgi:hypothetical protein
VGQEIPRSETSWRHAQVTAEAFLPMGVDQERQECRAIPGVVYKEEGLSSKTVAIKWTQFPIRPSYVFALSFARISHHTPTTIPSPRNAYMMSSTKPDVVVEGDGNLITTEHHEQHEGVMLGKVPHVEQLDKFGSHKKTDAHEIALVKKLDWYMLVSPHLTVMSISRDWHTSANIVVDVFVQLPWSQCHC